MTGGVLKIYSADDLRPARTTETPRLGDQVEFWLADGSAGATGFVGACLEDGWIRVGLDGIGSFILPPCRATVVGRAH